MKAPWKKIVIGGGVTLIVLGVALGVGLGVGLSRRTNNDDDDDDSSSSSATANATVPPFDASRLWQPAPNTSWQIVLSGIVAPPSASVALTPDVAVYDIDLFLHNASTVAALQQQGVRVICYFSAGSYEAFRPDKDDFAAADLGQVLDGWSDEKWVNVSSPALRQIMAKRIQMAADKGCDAIDPDNVDGYQNENGLGLTQDDAVRFVQFLATEAARYNMSTGLKNAGDIIPRLLPYVAFSVNEQCIQYAECATFAAFVRAGKPVFNIEYPDAAPSVSDAARAALCSGTGSAAHTDRFSTVIKTIDLDGWVLYCSGAAFNTTLV